MKTLVPNTNINLYPFDVSNDNYSTTVLALNAKDAKKKTLQMINDIDNYQLTEDTNSEIFTYIVMFTNNEGVKISVSSKDEAEKYAQQYINVKSKEDDSWNLVEISSIGELPTT